MILTYVFQINREGDTEDFEFEVDDHDLKKAVKTFNGGEVFLKELYEADEDLDEDNLEVYMDDLLEYFRQDANEAYSDAKEFARNPDRYYGVSRRD